MPIHPSGPPYRIAVAGLELRCWEPTDTPALQRLLADNADHLRPWVEWMATEPMPLDAKLREVRTCRAAFDRDDAWMYAITGEGGELIGGLLVNRLPGEAVELGWWGAADRGGRGLYTRAVAALVRTAFEVLGMTRVQAECEPHNEPSVRLMRRLGFIHESTPRHLVEGRRVEEMIWSILADEWPSTPAAQIAADARGWDALGERLF